MAKKKGQDATAQDVNYRMAYDVVAEAAALQENKMCGHDE